MARSKSVALARNELFTSSLEIDIDSNEFMFVKCRPMFRRELKRILKEVEAVSRADVRANHHKTGKLERSHKHEIGPSLAGGQRITGLVSAGTRSAHYAWYVHQGSDPHIIRAKPGKYLFFKGITPRLRKKVKVGRKSMGIPGIYDDVYEAQMIPGTRERTIAVKSVNHPGYKGDPFLNNALQKVVLRHGGRLSPRAAGR